ncbi:hypothetical protein [Zoogloea sp.]|uniref:hypothetical protein n=1 Tax=Zoogloea sp. TaxID=49181 RepID=UPI0026073D3A|nr:hypothetical protein [Zoogloea sp.]
MERYTRLTQALWRFLRAYPSLLALALLVLAVGIAKVAEAGAGLNILHRSAVHAGMAAYLISIAGFVAFGRRKEAWPVWTQIGVAAALGIAVTLSAKLYTDYNRPQPCTTVLTHMPARSCEASLPQQQLPDDPKAKSPLDDLSAFAAVLAVALAVLTLVAQKSASEARSEAEKAQEMIAGRRSEIHRIEIWVRLALESQRLRESGRKQIELFETYEAIDFDLATLHRKWSELHGAISRFLVELLHAVDSGEADKLAQQCSRIGIMAKDLDVSHRNQSDAAAHELLREQTRLFVAPLRRLLRKGIEFSEVDRGQMNPGHQRELREAMRKLDLSLTVLV